MKPILDYYTACFTEHGDTARGAGWPNASDRLLRFDVILDLVDFLAPDQIVKLCDIGCGSGELLRRIHERGRNEIEYVGVDALEEPLHRARLKFPDAHFEHLDVAGVGPEDVGRFSCDVLVANGLFTVKRALSHDAMWSFMTGVISAFWPVVRQGVIFNVMSPIVDWERDDLFHISYDSIAAFLHGLAGRSIGFRSDYGLYEYMAYAMKRPRRVTSAQPGAATPFR